MDESACYSEKNVKISEFCPSCHHSGGHTRIYWAGKSGIKSAAAEPNFITMAMVEKPLLLLHIFLSAPSIGSGSFSANHDTFADNDSIVEGDVEMTALTVNTGGLCGHLPIEGAEVPLHTMQSAMLHSVHSIIPSITQLCLITPHSAGLH